MTDNDDKEAATFTEVTLQFDESCDCLNAHLAETPINPNFSLADLQALIQAQQYESLFYEPNALTNLMKRVNEKERGVFPIALRKDAEVSVKVSSEAMKATITTTQPFGGKKVTQKRIKSAIAKARIKPEFCDLSALQKSLTEPVTDLVFAQGKQPVPGIDSSFNALVEAIVYHAPAIDEETGKADLNDILDFTTVDAGDSLMTRTPATEGENGCNVLGYSITAEPGQDTPFTNEIEGAIVDPSNENKIIATEIGHPVIMPDGVRVDKTLTVSDVDFRTGNIDIDGSLLVKGEVKSDMEITVTGDVIVVGVVANATITAGNDISIKGGVIGTEDKDEATQTPTATLNAGCSIKAQFVSLANLNAGKNIEVAEYIAHSEVVAKEKVLVGQDGGKGRVFGGHCQASESVIANIIGTETDVRTQVSVGATATHREKQAQLAEERAALSTQNQQLLEVLMKFKQLAETQGLNAEQSKKVVLIQENISAGDQKIEALTGQITQLSEELSDTSQSDITVKKAMFPNVLVAVNGLELPIRQEIKSAHFIQQGKDIKWTSL